jgi:flagellar assembly protein FliH
MSAYHRWELASLEPEPAGGREAEIARFRATAEQEGRAAGYAQGSAKAEAERSQLASLIATLATCVADHEQRLCDEVLDFSLVLARQLVGEALSVKREFVLPVVSAALKQLPQSTQRIELMLNPADAELVRTLMATHEFGPRCQIVADASIAPGGCRLETEQCEVDVTLSTRWRRLLAALGRSDDWLEPV